MKISKNTFNQVLIGLFLLVLMISESTGILAVKIARVILVYFLLIDFIKTKKWKSSFYIVWTLLFLIYNAIMIRYAFDKSYAFDYTLTLLYIVVENLMIFLYVRKYDILEYILKVFIVGSILKALRIFIKSGFLIFMNFRAAENTSANIIGLYSAIAFSLCIYFIITKKIKNKYLYFILAFICILFTILSASRKAILFLLIPLALYGITKTKNPIRLAKNIILVGLCLYIIYFFINNNEFLYNLVGNRLESMISGFMGGKTDGSTSTRLHLIEAGMKWFKDRPLFGYGLSNFKALNIIYRNSQYYAHNNYVELLVNCGLVGTIIYYSFYVKLLHIYYNCCKIDKKNIIILGILLCFIIGEYGLVTYDEAVFQILLMIIYLYGFNIINKEKLINNNC